jgi:hypothetical protein
LIGAALVLFLVIGVILGVTIPLTTNNDKDIDLTQSPKAPAAVPMTCTSLDCFAKISKILLKNTVTDADALQNDFSPQF